MYKKLSIYILFFIINEENDNTASINIIALFLFDNISLDV